MFTLAGNFIKWMKKRQEKSLTILLLGLDNAGKSTLLFGLKDQLPDTVTPTIGFRPSTIVRGKYTIQWFDVGGAKNFRSVWQSYYSEVRWSRSGELPSYIVLMFTMLGCHARLMSQTRRCPP